MWSAQVWLVLANLVAAGVVFVLARRLGLARLRGGTRNHRIVSEGMVTAEYAVGILAAAALALVLLKVFQNTQFVQALLGLIKAIMAKVTSMI